MKNAEDKHLGRLTKVELREAWKSEANNFTPWLAEGENLQLLGETIGIDLVLAGQEVGCGPFRADILCKDAFNDAWVLIENQLERTDHTHLGQLITYAAGLNAVNIVWIAQHFTDEHRAALDWLNEHTDEKINFFGIEIELWKIGNSSIAPKFNVVSQPNDWSRTIKDTAMAGDHSEYKQQRFRFWAAFRDYMENAKSTLKFSKPSCKNWMNHRIGHSNIILSSHALTRTFGDGSTGPKIRAMLYLQSTTSKLAFAKLESQKDSIEKALGFPLTWDINAKSPQACFCYTSMDSDFTDETLWPQQFAWLREHLEKMQKVFAPLITDL